MSPTASERFPRPSLMGIVNVTPDSFSDGGRYAHADAAIARVHELVADGATIVDLGGESTRPGSEPVPLDEELRRLVPVLEGLAGAAPVSVDTAKAEVARRALALGAELVNEVTALRGDPQMAEVVAASGSLVCLMHMQGTPGSMQKNPVYADVVGEVADFLRTRAAAAVAAGVPREAIWIDPGIGFGKTLEHNLDLLANLDRIKALGLHTVLGVSRKRVLRAIDPTAVESGDRLGGSLAGALIGAQAGMDAVRVHDVRETVQALTVWAAVSARPAAVS